MKPAAFLFDLDGTLVDTEEAWAGAIVDFLAERGVDTTIGDILPSIVGRNWLDINGYLHRRFPEIGESTLEEDSKRLRTFFNVRVSDPTTLIIKDSVEFLRRAAAEAPVAIVSGSPRADIEKAARMMEVDALVRFSLRRVISPRRNASAPIPPRASSSRIPRSASPPASRRGCAS